MKGRSASLCARYAFPDPGELRERILFRQRQDRPDKGAGLTAVYGQEHRVWGKCIPVGETLRMNSLQINSAITHRIVVRYHNALYSSNEAVIKGLVYRLRGVTDVNGAGCFMAFSCEELRNDPHRRGASGLSAY